MRRRGLGRFNLTVTAPAEIDDLSLEALKALVVQLLSKVAEQERLIALLKEKGVRLPSFAELASGANIGGAGRSCHVSPSRIG